MIIHLRSLDKETLANQIYEEQKTNKWPGLYEETRVICEELQIEDCNLTSLSKQKYRDIVLAACHKKNEETLRAKATQGKCVRIGGEEYGRKDYTIVFRRFSNIGINGWIALKYIYICI